MGEARHVLRAVTVAGRSPAAPPTDQRGDLQFPGGIVGVGVFVQAHGFLDRRIESPPQRRSIHWG